jgi:hypothetical protein
MVCSGVMVPARWAAKIAATVSAKAAPKTKVARPRQRRAICFAKILHSAQQEGGGLDHQISAIT